MKENKKLPVDLSDQRKMDLGAHLVGRVELQEEAALSRMEVPSVNSESPWSETGALA